MITIRETKNALPALQQDDYRTFFQQERMKFLSGTSWKKIAESFWREMRLNVSANDVDALLIFLRNRRDAILENYRHQEFFVYWERCFNNETKLFDEVKFIKILVTVYDGQIDRSDLDAFFSWHCLTMHIDALLSQVLERQRSFAGATVNFFYNDGGEIHFGSSSTKERKDDVTEEDPLKNLIFNERLFDSNSRLSKLRNTIAGAIDMGDATIMYGKPQEMRINPAIQNEWYYIVKAIEESGVAKGKLTDTGFVEQMVEWFPMLFPDETPEKFKEYKRKLTKSISGERTLWKQGRMKTVVTLREMWAKGVSKILGTAKAERVYEIAYKGLFTSLETLKHEIERENNLR